MREKAAAIADSKYQYHLTNRARRKRPARLRGVLSRSERRDPEKVAETVLAYLRARPKSGDIVILRDHIKLHETRAMGVQDSVARKALHLLNLRGFVTQAVHYGGRYWGASWQEDVFFVCDKVRA